MTDATVELEPELPELAGDFGHLAKLLDNIAGAFKNLTPARIRQIVIHIAEADCSAKGQELWQKLVAKFSHDHDLNFLHLCYLVNQEAEKMVD